MTIDIIIWLQSFMNDFWDFFFNFISFLGEEYVYIVILGIYYYAVDKKVGIFLAFTLFLTGVINTVLKGIINAPRPFEKYPNEVINLRPETAGGSSFPSGHTQNFTTFTFSMVFYYKKKLIFMAISRMYLGVHFLEDVTFSILIGIPIAYILYQLFEKAYNNKGLMHKVYLGSVVVGIIFAFFIQTESYYKALGLLIGFILAIHFEEKFVRFKIPKSYLKKGIRVITGLILMIAIRFGLSALFDLLTDNDFVLIVLDGVRYFTIAFVGLGLYPMAFKKFKF